MSTYELMSSSDPFDIGSTVYSRCIAMSLTGQYIAVCVTNGLIYTSSDYGYSWSPTIAPSAYWRGITMSSSGQYVAACIYGTTGTTGIYTNTNYGNGDWLLTSAPGANWFSIAMSSTGQSIVACIYATAGTTTGIYISNNNGNSWLQSYPNNYNWKYIVMSSSGQYIAACIYSGGIYISNNNGNSWTQTTAPSENWNSIAMSSSGQYIVACIQNGGIYISTNYGSNWTKTSAQSAQWQSIAMSSSGQYIIACDDNSTSGGVFINTNYGNGDGDWSQIIPSTNSWISVTMNSSGQKISTFQNTNNTLYNYNLYTNVNPETTFYFGILQNYQFDLNPGYYINIIDPQTSGLGGTGKIYILNITSGYSTYLLFRSIYNSTGITQNQLYILNDPTLFHDTNISIYFSYIYGTVTIITNILCSFNVTVEGSFNYNLPESLSSSSGQVPTSSVPINFQ
jgi:hypothetical protein